jgi:hypothetical protein
MDTKTKFNRNMKKYHGISNRESHHIYYYIGLKRRPLEIIEDEDIEYFEE